MKPSHLRTPRNLDECQFQTGYRCAERRDPIAEMGHVVLNFFCAVGLVAVLALIVSGVL